MSRSPGVYGLIANGRWAWGYGGECDLAIGEQHENENNYGRHERTARTMGRDLYIRAYRTQHIYTLTV